MDALRKTPSGLVTWCRENLGMPYWYCSQGQKPTAAWLDAKIKQYPGKWTPPRVEKAKREIGKFARRFDCVGLVKGYLWLQPDGRLKYGAAQDKSADGLRAASNPQPVSALPELPGALLFMPGHVGVYIGGGRVIEAHGFKCVEERPLSAQKWTRWGALEWIGYGEAQKTEQPKPSAQGGAYTVRPGDSPWRIAAQQLGDGLRWRELMRFNGLPEDAPMRPGQALKLPERKNSHEN